MYYIRKLIEFSERETCKTGCFYKPQCLECQARGIVDTWEDMAALFMMEVAEEEEDYE